MQGIIIQNIANLYKIASNQLGTNIKTKPQKDLSKENSIYEAMARGKFKKEEISPVVGDFVEFEVTDEKNKKAVIDKIFDRKVYVKRPKLANITQIVFVVSSQSPKPDLLMLDKQLAFAEFLGLKAIIILNKIDLDDKMQLKKIQNIYEKIGYKVIRNGCQKQKRN